MPEYTKSRIPELIEAGLYNDPETRQRQTRPRIKARFERFRRTENDVTTTSREDRVREFIRRMHEGYKYKRGELLRPEKFGLGVFKMVMPSIAKNILGPQWASVGTRLSREFGWDIKRHPKLFLGQAPRRFGKTIIVVMIIVTYAIVMPGSIISTYSTSRRTSQLLKSVVLEIIRLNGLSHWLLKCSEEELHLQNPECLREGYSVLNFYPSNPKTLRGTHAHDFVICDEMAYMDPEVFYQIIMPLLGIDSTNIIGISTPVSDQFNFFDRLINLCYPGTNDPIFATYKVELVCQACKRNGKINTCRHKLHLLPSWKSKEKFDLIKHIYEGVGREETRQRESLGLNLADKSLVFDQNQVAHLFNLPPVSKLRSGFQPTIVYMGVDPNAGSAGVTHSHMAIVTVAEIMDITMIVGIDSHPCGNWKNSKALFKSHIEGLRRNPFLQSAWIVSIIERNTGHESGHLSEELDNYVKTYPFYQSAKPARQTRFTERENPGVWTDRFNKGMYAKAISDCLAEKKLRFLKDCVCANPFQTADNALKTAKKELQSQMSRARWIANQRTVDTGHSISSWSAKSGPDGKLSKGINDDIVVTLGMTMHWKNRIEGGKYPSVDYNVLRC